jgi:hypothetical protein
LEVAALLEKKKDNIHGDRTENLLWGATLHTILYPVNFWCSFSKSCAEKLHSHSPLFCFRTSEAEVCFKFWVPLTEVAEKVLFTAGNHSFFVWLRERLFPFYGASEPQIKPFPGLRTFALLLRSKCFAIRNVCLCWKKNCCLHLYCFRMARNHPGPKQGTFWIQKASHPTCPFDIRTMEVLPLVNKVAWP